MKLDPQISQEKRKKERNEAREEKSAVDIWREFVGEIDHIHPL